MLDMLCSRPTSAFVEELELQSLGVSLGSTMIALRDFP
jgi:hypothetical protein